jgi:hypothetical protein
MGFMKNKYIKITFDSNSVDRCLSCETYGRSDRHEFPSLPKNTNASCKARHWILTRKWSMKSETCLVAFWHILRLPSTHLTEKWQLISGFATKTAVWISCMSLFWSYVVPSAVHPNHTWHKIYMGVKLGRISEKEEHRCWCFKIMC